MLPNFFLAHEPATYGMGDSTRTVDCHADGGMARRGSDDFRDPEKSSRRQRKCDSSREILSVRIPFAKLIERSRRRCICWILPIVCLVLSGTTLFRTPQKTFLTTTSRFQHRVAVVKACVGPYSVTIRSASVLNSRHYAERHGYAFLEINEETYVKTPFMTPFSWLKIAFLYDLLREGAKYEWIVMFDCDSLVLNVTYAVESILSELKVTNDHQLIFTEDSPESAHASPFNAGVFFMRNSAWSLKELEQVLRLASEANIRNHGWWEQAAFHALYRENTMEEHHKILIVPQRWKFNAFYHLNEANSSTVIWHRPNCKVQPRCDNIFISTAQSIIYPS